MAGELAAGAGAGDGPVAVGLGLDTSRFESQLNKASSAVDRAAKSMDLRFQQTANKIKASTAAPSEAMKRLSEAVTGGFAGGLAAGGVMGALPQIGEVGGKAIKEMVVGMRRVNQEGVEMQRWAAAVNDRFARMAKGMDERLGAIFDPKDKIAEIDAQITKQSEKFKALRAVGDEVAKTLDDSNGVLSPDGWRWAVSGEFDSTQEKLKASLQTVEQQAEATKTKINDLLDLRGKVADASKNDAFKAAVNQFEDNISLQFKSLKNKDTPLEQQLRAIQHQFRATDEAMAAVLGKARSFEQAQAVNTFVDDLDQKLKTLDMSPLEQQLASLADKFKLTGADVEAATEKIQEFERRQKEVDAKKLFEAEKRAAILAMQKVGKNEIDQQLLDFADRGMNGDQLDEMRGLLIQKARYGPVERADAMIAGGKDTTNAILGAQARARAKAAQANAGQGGVPGGKQSEAQVAENTGALLKVFVGVAGNIEQLVAQQKAYEKLLREQNMKAGGDDGLFPIDG